MQISLSWWADKPKDKRKDITIYYFVRLKYQMYKEVTRRKQAPIQSASLI